MDVHCFICCTNWKCRQNELIYGFGILNFYHFRIDFPMNFFFSVFVDFISSSSNYVWGNGIISLTIQRNAFCIYFARNNFNYNFKYEFRELQMNFFFIFFCCFAHRVKLIRSLQLIINYIYFSFIGMNKDKMESLMQWKTVAKSEICFFLWVFVLILL